MAPHPTLAGNDTVWLTPFAVAGQVLSMGMTLLLAHLLLPDDFETYVMAASLFILLMSLAPLGSDKLALRVLPPLLDAAVWPDVRAFLRFAVRRSLLGTALALLAVLVWVALSGKPGTPVWHALALAGLALPFGVATQVGQEMLTAAGKAGRAMFAARVVPPLVAGLAVGAAMLAGWRISNTFALGGWLAGWAIAAGWLIWSLRPLLTRPAPTDSRAQAETWAKAARPLWFYRVATVLRSQAGILALLWFGTASGQVGVYATAQALTGLFLVPVAATNRIYARDLARFIHRDDSKAITAMLRRRLGWVLPWVLAVLGVVWWAGEWILGILQPEFNEIGAAPLRVLTLSAAVAMLLALGPTRLKFQDRSSLVALVMGATATLQIFLLFALPAHLKATGAALAYAIPTSIAYALFAVLSATGRTVRRD